jgi:transcriptional/translational regulatory protein YebC/TACO1
LELTLNNGAEDVKTHTDHFEVLCHVNDYCNLSKAFSDEKIAIESQELVYVPNSTAAINDPESAQKILQLFEKVDELDDVKSVSANYDIPSEISLAQGNFPQKRR